MIKTEAQERKTNEELFYQYLNGIEHNARMEANRAWVNFTRTNAHSDMAEAANAYIKYARADEKVRTIEKILSVYIDQVRGGMTI